jgi:hypothetical protein
VEVEGFQRGWAMQEILDDFTRLETLASAMLKSLKSYFSYRRLHALGTQAAVVVYALDESQSWRFKLARFEYHGALHRDDCEHYYSDHAVQYSGATARVILGAELVEQYAHFVELRSALVLR